jgi:hypothetical protein
MMKGNSIRSNPKLQFCALVLLCLMLSGCAGDDSPDLINQGSTNVSFNLKANVGPRREVCWKGKSRLKEIELQQLSRTRFQRLKCNVIVRRALDREQQVLALLK